MANWCQDIDFCKIVPILLQLEGGLVSNPSDPGGTTNFGISQRSYPSLNIASLTAEDAANLYYTDYWLANNCDAMPVPLCYYFFDACVNQGPANAKTMLQQCVGVAADGVIGPLTMAAIQAMASADYYTYLTTRLSHYESLSTWNVFGKGWTTRLLRLAALT